MKNGRGVSRRVDTVTNISINHKAEHKRQTFLLVLHRQFVWQSLLVSRGVKVQECWSTLCQVQTSLFYQWGARVNIPPKNDKKDKFEHIYNYFSVSFHPRDGEDSLDNLNLLNLICHYYNYDFLTEESTRNMVYIFYSSHIESGSWYLGATLSNTLAL